MPWRAKPRRAGKSLLASYPVPIKSGGHYGRALACQIKTPKGREPIVRAGVSACQIARQAVERAKSLVLLRGGLLRRRRGEQRERGGRALVVVQERLQPRLDRFLHMVRTTVAQPIVLE